MSRRPFSLPRQLALCAVFVALGTLPLAALDAARTARLLDGSADQMLYRASIPSDHNYHGEVRLLRRGDARVLQTLLYSARLPRGLQRMRKKELYYWSDTAPGAADSARYIEDLEAVGEKVMSDFREREDRSDRKKRMLIELVLAPEDSFYALYDVETRDDVGPDNDGLVLLRKDPIVVRETSRQYLGRELRLQAETAFERQLQELEDLPQ